MHIHHQALSLEDRIALTIAAGRDVAERIKRSDVSRTPHEDAFLDRCLARVAQGEPLDPRDDGGLEAVSAILRREIQRETLDVIRIFEGVCDPEAGDIGDVVETAVLSDRGTELFAILAAFDRFRSLRRQVCDRINADRILARVSRG